MSNKPMALTESDMKEIAHMKWIREMWGAETFEEMLDILDTKAYAAKFDFVSGGPGYCGDYYIIQGDALGEGPIELVRRDGKLVGGGA
jgi:hypothetical protein